MKQLLLAISVVAVLQAAVVPIQNEETHIRAEKRNHTQFNKLQLESRLMSLKYLEIPPDAFAEVAPELTIDGEIPDSFDARKAWPRCQSIGSIAEQSNCASSWAVSTASAITDRICVASGETNYEVISADDILSCCSYCGDGCAGGYSISAWIYFMDKGVCTGSSYMEQSGCKPYSFPPCTEFGKYNETYYHTCPRAFCAPKCEEKCQPDHLTSYEDDKYHGESAYLVNNSVSVIQKEIMVNGPVTVTFTVYEDFPSYQEGIYEHIDGADVIGVHSAKIIGWGSEEGTPYWLLTNSWGDNWGESGFFRMLRGVDECGIESHVVAGDPEKDGKDGKIRK